MPPFIEPPTTRFNPHAPPHWFVPGATYMITASTLYRRHLWDTRKKRDYLTHNLITMFQESGWSLLAWAVMLNHYHLIAIAPEQIALSDLMRHLHSRTAKWLNRQDGTPKRRFWYQYWDTCLTHQTSTYARLHYVHGNPVHHGIVADAREYRWCSMGWFLRTAEDWRAEQIMLTPCDKVNVMDDF